MRLLITIFTVLVATTSATGSSFSVTTPLYDTSSSNGSCNAISNGSQTRCDFSGSWANGSSTTSGYSSTYTGDNGVTSVMIQSSLSYNDNWGSWTTSSVLSLNSGVSWGVSEFFNRIRGSWSGTTASSDGQVTNNTGQDDQTNHTVYQFLSVWNCISGTGCRTETWWVQTNTHDYLASGWWSTTIYNQLVSSGDWSTVLPTLFTSDSGHEVNWSVLDGAASIATETPEPSTYAMLGLGGLACAAGWRRKNKK